MLRQLLQLGTMVVALSFSVTAWTQSTAVVFGPEAFNASVRGNNINRTFTAASNVDGVLTVVNGDGTDIVKERCSGPGLPRILCQIRNLGKDLQLALTRPSFLEISLNGQKILTNGPYDPSLGRFQIAIKTRSGLPINNVGNLLNLQIRGAPLARINLDIRVQTTVVNQPPIARFTFGPDNAVAPALVSFSGLLSQDSDGQIVSYNWEFSDGGTATGALVSYSFQTGGVFTARLTVIDNQGATGSFSQNVTVVTDVTPPTLVSIEQRFVVTGLPANIPVTLTASELLRSASVNGQALVVQGSQAVGNISINQAGSFSVSIDLVDLVGNRSTEVRPVQVLLDQILPIINVDLPGLLATNLNQITVPISVTDETEVLTTLTLNGIQILSTRNKDFSYQVNLPTDSDYQLVISGVDEAGRVSATTEILIRKDSIAPILTNVQPVDGDRLNSRLVVVTGQVNEAVNISVNGTSAVVGPSGQFTASVRASSDGSFPILIQATDTAGNLSSSSFNILIDTGSDSLWTYEECPVNGEI